MPFYIYLEMSQSAQKKTSSYFLFSAFKATQSLGESHVPTWCQTVLGKVQLNIACLTPFKHLCVCHRALWVTTMLFFKAHIHRHRLFPDSSLYLLFLPFVTCLHRSVFFHASYSVHVSFLSCSLRARPSDGDNVLYKSHFVTLLLNIKIHRERLDRSELSLTSDGVNIPEMSRSHVTTTHTGSHNITWLHIRWHESPRSMTWFPWYLALFSHTIQNTDFPCTAPWHTISGFGVLLTGVWVQESYY